MTLTQLYNELQGLIKDGHGTRDVFALRRAEPEDVTATVIGTIVPEEELIIYLEVQDVPQE